MRTDTSERRAALLEDHILTRAPAAARTRPTGWSDACRAGRKAGRACAKRTSRFVAGMVLAAAALVAGCDARLPDPESPGARLYAARCGGCHRIYAPQVMTSQMWRVTVARMQGELARRSLPVLSATDQTLLLDYLDRHSTEHEG